MLQEKLQIVKQRFDEVADLIIQPDIIADQKRYVALNREYKDLSALMEKRSEYLNLLNNKNEAQTLIAEEKDAEMLAMAKEELDESTKKLDILEDAIRFMLIPKDPEDSKNVMMELRAGTGGDEASIFAGDLYRMYTKYCESKGSRIESKLEMAAAKTPAKIKPAKPAGNCVTIQTGKTKSPLEGTPPSEGDVGSPPFSKTSSEILGYFASCATFK